MKTASMTLVLLLIVLCCAGVGRAQTAPAKSARPAAGSPAAVVAELYKVHNNGNGGLFEKKGRKHQEQFFEE